MDDKCTVIVFVHERNQTFHLFDRTYDSDAIASIRVLARFAYPNIFALIFNAGIRFFSLKMLKSLYKLSEIRILDAIFYKMRLWQILEYLFTLSFVVFFHVQK